MPDCGGWLFATRSNGEACELPDLAVRARDNDAVDYCAVDETRLVESRTVTGSMGTSYDHMPVRAARGSSRSLARRSRGVVATAPPTSTSTSTTGLAEPAVPASRPCFTTRSTDFSSSTSTSTPVTPSNLAKPVTPPRQATSPLRALGGEPLSAIGRCVCRDPSI